ncbi:serine/threonine-protein kinase-like protein [Pseudovirgaria hyperparasitica]|uniref:Serine/threonine-protein kinase-like protein n=1 Tax=Pseudovirgaria hyperparasitica TaxID=470096 RepID=A0A6A6WHC3_9PEZI|nr:serine/threonine-protein kinase-like protein [Pseudovirgaria hyperparasitica]KAF2761047.1 serine/threonine-protein kinase-like protein [Pseudovirgaria hyperparasitica]
MFLGLRNRICSLWRDTVYTSSLFAFLGPIMRYFQARLRRHQLRCIESVRDLSPRYEAFSDEDDEYGNPIFLYSSFGYISDDYIAYFGESKLRKRDLSKKDIMESLQLLPDEDVYPLAPPNVTVFATPVNSNVYVKGPKLHTDFIGTGMLPKLLLQEVEVMELLRCKPHPNIIHYHGCIIKRGRIVGIVLDRHADTLGRRLKDGLRQFNVEEGMGKIRSAVGHLHSLGLAHNDLTPMNIMADSSDELFIIDFGSCQPVGCELITAGTPGWIDEEFTHSAQVHDEIALGKLETWLQTKKEIDIQS